MKTPTKTFAVTINLSEYKIPGFDDVTPEAIKQAEKTIGELAHDPVQLFQAFVLLATLLSVETNCRDENGKPDLSKKDEDRLRGAISMVMASALTWCNESAESQDAH
ncbi:hypothetical protein [Candidatus Sororendozoicomonas aggregata]|uniref:hypothetical protein n=1 Tax=Candidatus Sororendozoicomonas aggregata TaxID=3073239 RepID=UPI002ED4C4D6